MRGRLSLPAAARALLQVSAQVFLRLQPDREADEPVADSERCPDVCANLLMRGAGGVGGEALGIAQVVGNVDQLQCIEKAEGGVPPARELEGDHAAAPAHLLRRKRVLGVARKARIVHGIHGGVAFEKSRKPLRRFAHAGRAQLQRLQALEHNPGVEGAHDRPRGAHEGHKIVCEKPFVAQDGAAQAAALAVDVLGRGIDDDVGTEDEGTLNRRHTEHIVHDDAGANAVGKGRDRGDVDDRHSRVAGAFEEDAAGLWPERALPGVEIGAVHEVGLDAVSRQQLVNHHVAGAEHDAGRDDMVTRAKLAHK